MALGSCALPAVLQYLDLARERGLAIPALLSAAGLTAECVDGRQERLAGERFQALILAMREQTGDDTLGLASARFVQPGSYSVLGYIAMNSDSLAQALERALPFEKLVGDMGRSTLTPVPGGLALRWRCQYDHPQVVPQMVDNVLASWTGFARHLLDDAAACPAAVQLRRPRPADGGAAHEAWFGCPVTFGADSDALFIPDTILDRPVARPDTELRRVLEQHARSKLVALDQEDDLRLRVRALIRQALSQGPVRRERIAEALNMTEKTLQRRLAQCHTQYQSELDAIRQEMAKDWLEASPMPVSEIALRLGFSEPRSFQRRFKAWTGLPPGAYRERAREARP
ncbi:AraC family transcriptional regulator [Ferrimonas balearica]|uniref:AraC family transcriptional regulator n=1 Tax=Ferrimonas balearica TaxID=44012 RepID=UPI001C98E7FA|nr:AraC family transcriptional regulator [Ferrimonas balearica]MBY5993911.1 AraC family transcriptional regulator [Ferrimonas balearica]